MSVAEMLSPMSVDKSAMIEEQIEKKLPRTDRDRFFEVTEYQDDILTYMKDAEVSVSMIQNV
jgi:predicted glycosyltransferase